MEEIIRWGVVLGASLVAAVMDVRTRRIPNRLCGPLFLTGLIWSAWQNGAYGFAEAFGSAALMAFPFVLLFIFAGGGAGDAKLTGALGAWLGIKEAGIALACICIAGALLAILVALYKGRLKIVLARLVLPVWDLLAGIFGGANMKQAVKSARVTDGEKLTVPYGVAIFAGVCVAAGIMLL
ncbi:MAG: A24 family peptidase [Planctomycetota bacterium]